MLDEGFVKCNSQGGAPPPGSTPPPPYGGFVLLTHLYFYLAGVYCFWWDACVKRLLIMVFITMQGNVKTVTAAVVVGQRCLVVMSLSLGSQSTSVLSSAVLRCRHLAIVSKASGRGMSCLHCLFGSTFRFYFYLETPYRQTDRRIETVHHQK